MKNGIKKLITFGLATVMVISSSIVAFAYAERDNYFDIGDGQQMTCHIDVDTEDMHASMDIPSVGDLLMDGTAYYYDFGESNSTAIYAGADQETSYGTSQHRDLCRFYYAGISFSASLNEGGYNRVFMNCRD